jgi:hypothetical protein
MDSQNRICFLSAAIGGLIVFDRFPFNCFGHSMTESAPPASDAAVPQPPPSEESPDDPMWEILDERVTSRTADQLFKEAEDRVIWNYWPLGKD